MSKTNKILQQFTKVISDLEDLRDRQAKQVKWIISVRDRAARLANRYICLGLEEQQQANEAIKRLKKAFLGE